MALTVEKEDKAGSFPAHERRVENGVVRGEQLRTETAMGGVLVCSSSSTQFWHTRRWSGWYPGTRYTFKLVHEKPVMKI